MYGYIEKNTMLLRCIENYPCLYNNKMPEHYKNELREEAWTEVAMKTKLHVSECKDKWNTMRLGILRSLRQSKIGTRKKYYLQHEMEFLIPYISMPKARAKRRVQKDKNEEEPEVTVLSEQSSQSFESDMLHIEEPPMKRIKTEDSETEFEKEQTDLEIEESELEKEETEFDSGQTNHTDTQKKKNVNDNSRRMFLLSLLPEVDDMTEKQMRLFKRKVLHLIDDIVDTSS